MKTSFIVFPQASLTEPLYHKLVTEKDQSCEQNDSYQKSLLFKSNKRL